MTYLIRIDKSNWRKVRDVLKECGVKWLGGFGHDAEAVASGCVRVDKEEMDTWFAWDDTDPVGEDFYMAEKEEYGKVRAVNAETFLKNPSVIPFLKPNKQEKKK